MKSMIFFLMLFLFSCANKSHQTQDKKYVLMESLWSKGANKEQVIQLLGNQYEEIEKGIVYKYPNYRYIESGHFFDASNILIEQFLFLDATSFDDFKHTIPCSWDEKEEMESSGHTVHSIKSGKCIEKNIQYKFKPSMNAFEVRWKK